MCWYSSYIQLMWLYPLYTHNYIDMLWIHVYESAWCMHIMLVSSLKSYCWNCTYLLCPLLFLQLEPHILQSNTWVHGIDGFGSSPSINETRNTHTDSSCDWIVQMVWYDDHTETLFGSSNHQKPCTVTIYALFLVLLCLEIGILHVPQTTSRATCWHPNHKTQTFFTLIELNWCGNLAL